MRIKHPPSKTRGLEALDLADFESVASFAADFSKSHGQLDLLINNAGVMIPPKDAKTRQGFELQFGVNHLGHFALTGQLLPLPLSSKDARVVNLSSGAHHHEDKKDFDDINFEKRGYQPWRAYCQSKLSNLLFTNELQDRRTAAKADVISVAAHPGFTRTDLQRGNIVPRLLSVLAMKPEQGALPTLRAACALVVKGGDYYGLVVPNFKATNKASVAGKSRTSVLMPRSTKTLTPEVSRIGSTAPKLNKSTAGIPKYPITNTLNVPATSSNCFLVDTQSSESDRPRHSDPNRPIMPRATVR